VSVLKHKKKVRNHYENTATISPFGLSYRVVLAKYSNHFLPNSNSLLEVGCGEGHLLALLRSKSKTGLDICSKALKKARRQHSSIRFFTGSAESPPKHIGKFDDIILAEILNEAYDVQQILVGLHQFARPQTRLLISLFSALWRPFFFLMELIGWKQKTPELNWLSRGDIKNLLHLSGWDVVRIESKILMPVNIPWVTEIINRWVAPLLPFLCLNCFVIARAQKSRPSSRVSVIVPARNEAGNIRDVCQRIPKMGSHTEIIFVEGHSRDMTWEAIQSAKHEFQNKKIIAITQSGTGKGNAVGEGFAIASGEILMILDADLTTPPEDLPKFYSAIVSGRAEFANGVRLIYPMEKKAMRFLNLAANHFFSKSFSWILGQPIKDTLCGTKVLWKNDWEKIQQNRKYFGEFDPFGDFDLLFGADYLNLRIKDIPIRYRERTYGSTNIQRWKHGVLLMQMLAFAAKKVKFI